MKVHVKLLTTLLILKLLTTDKLPHFVENFLSYLYISFYKDYVFK